MSYSEIIKKGQERIEFEEKMKSIEMDYEYKYCPTPSSDKTHIFMGDVATLLAKNNLLLEEVLKKLK